ncbi:phage baseplate assembly protein [Mannheimia massilioguelmaensis]|uniref:phage baseplate assembly protein n=1 Tax=Mannheimia massilioguelmaensis TaxID=1604354 RepID=UPI0005C974EA|nr:contractile injection system protein, VgrG/Pvc8 family [Mannheimia massilioguelmaensis]
MTNALKQSDIKLYLNGLIFTGWKRISVRRSLESMSGQFELGIAVRPEDDATVLKVGASLQLKINGHNVITGYLDELKQSISGNDKTIDISGRDKTCDLVDCSVIHDSYHFKKQTVKQIAESLCKPFGIAVVWAVDTAEANETLPVWQVEPGETVFDTLQKLARHKGILVTSDVDGNLVFTEPSTQQNGHLVLGENLLSLDVMDCWTNRYSMYRVIGDAEQGGEKGDTVKNAKKRKSKKDKSAIPDDSGLFTGG